MVENQVVYARAGEHPEVTFARESGKEMPHVAKEATPDTDEKTTLRIHVPADAKIFLAGRPTRSTGELRVFQTDHLADGKTWEGYTIRAELDQNGTTVTEERKITLTAGQVRDITFDFSQSRVASLSRNQ